MYPTIRVQHLNHRFDPYLYNAYKESYDDKAIAKSNGDKMLEGYAKLVINSLYGKYNSKYSFIYSPSTGYGTAINGQLCILMLIEELHLNGFKILGTNTDSITLYVPLNKMETYKSICYSWEEKVKMKLDHDEFSAIYEQSCNNYIAVMKNGYVKTKGFFVEELELTKGYEHPIVKLALIKYFTEKIPIEKTIREHGDIYDFCISTRMGTAKEKNFDEGDLFEFDPLWIDPKFDAYHNGIKLQRTNRFFAAKGGLAPYLYKSSNGVKMQHVLKDSGVTIFNKYIEKPMKEYNINYDFYEAKCRKIINEIEPEQLNLF